MGENLATDTCLSSIKFQEKKLSSVQDPQATRAASFFYLKVLKKASP
jgi:hypothetical protein